MAPRRNRGKGSKRGGRVRAPIQHKADDQPAVDYTAQLPDKLLVTLFSYVPIDDLLVMLRLVCRRWRDVALTPSVWTGRRLDVGEGSCVHLIRGVLRLAPCLGLLYVKPSGWDMIRPEDVRLPVTGGICLELTSQASVRDGTAVLRRQAAFEHRRHIQVDVLQPLQLDAAHRLLEAINDCQPWSIVLSGNFSVDGLKSCPAPAAKASVTRVIFMATHKPSPGSLADILILKYIIVSHAATLDDVRMYLPWRPRLPASLLDGCVNLQKLYCSELDRMDHLLSICPALGELAMTPQTVSSGTLSYFRQATQLRRLLFRDTGAFPGKDVAERHAEDTLAFLEALTSSGESSLTSLSYEVPEKPSPAYWSRLAMVISPPSAAAS